jgi:hypothetical protein
VNTDSLDPANARELSNTAREIGADVLQGDLRYPSETGGWQLGDLDLSEYLDRYRDQQVVVIIAPLGRAPDPTCTCGICGFVMNEAMECPRCKLIIEETVRGRERETQAPMDAIEAFLVPDQGGCSVSGWLCTGKSHR